MKHLKYSGFLALGLIALPIMGAQAETVWSGNSIGTVGKPIYSNMPTPADLPGDKFKPIGVLPPVYEKPIAAIPPIYSKPIAKSPGGLDPIYSNMPEQINGIDIANYSSPNCSVCQILNGSSPSGANSLNTITPKLALPIKQPPITSADLDPKGAWSIETSPPIAVSPNGLNPEYSNFPTPISAELGDDTHPVLYNEGYFDQSDVASSSDVKDPSIGTAPVKEVLYDDGGGVFTPNNALPLAPIRNVSSDMPKLSTGLVATKNQRDIASKSNKIGNYKIAKGEVVSQWNAE